MTTANNDPVLQTYEFKHQIQITNETFEDVGFGPFVVRRQRLVNEILESASPKRSCHINGCKGSGKTTLLHQLGILLMEKNERVYYFDNASHFNKESTGRSINDLVRSKQKVYLLVDETQNNPTAAEWTALLKNTSGHKITVIGAGVPAWNSMSGDFKMNIATERLFVSSEMLTSESILDFFSRNASTMDQRKQITLLLGHIRSYVGGHIYPLMFLSENLVPNIVAGSTAEDAVRSLYATEFRRTREFSEMVARIIPNLDLQIFRSLLTTNPDVVSLERLRRYGFIDSTNSVISQLLFDEYVKSRTGSRLFEGRLEVGVAGVQQLLSFSLPNLEWQQYDNFGGPFEDSLTFELLLILSRVSHLDTRLFNPKLVNYNAGRKPDLYLNTTINSFVECVLTTTNTATERKKLDEHISRFYWESYKDPTRHQGPSYYQIGNSDYAILNFQNFGDTPMEPFDSFFQGQIYSERVFTFVMPMKCVYQGNQLIASG